MIFKDFLILGSIHSEVDVLRPLVEILYLHLFWSSQMKMSTIIAGELKIGRLASRQTVSAIST